MIPIRTAILVAALAIVGPAAAADVCVSCTGPDVTYRCSVKNADTIAGLAGDKALEKICRKVLKNTGSHASCSVRKGDGPCPGTPKMVGWDDVKEAAAVEAEGALPDKGGDKSAKPKAEAKKPAERAKAAAVDPGGHAGAAEPPPVAGAPPAAKEPAANPPPVKQQTARGAAAPVQSPEAKPPPAEEPPSESLGDKIKGAAEKTWTCMSSLFGKC